MSRINLHENSWNYYFRFRSDKTLDLNEIDSKFYAYMQEMRKVGRKLVYWIEKVLGLVVKTKSFIKSKFLKML